MNLTNVANNISDINKKILIEREKYMTTTKEETI